MPYNPARWKHEATRSSQVNERVLTVQTTTAGSEDLRLYQLKRYLERLQHTADTSHIAQLAISLWQQIEHAVKSYPVVSLSPAGQVLFAWDRDEHHLEIEVFPDGHIEAFYYNLQTAETWDHDVVLDRIDEKLLEYLTRV